MTAKLMLRVSVLAALLVATCFVADACASCCGGGTTAFYPSTAYAAPSAVAYTSYRTGWYPGYWLDRVSARLWGSPSTYVAAYPTTYTAAYAPAYTAAYRPAYSVGHASSYAPPVAGCSTCSTYSASYAPACTTCAPVQQVTLRPVCTTACSPCSACSTCGPSAVAAYQQPPAAGCTTCGTSVAVQGAAVVQPGAMIVPAPAPAVAVPTPQLQVAPAPTLAPQSTFGGQNGAPSLPSDANVPTQREEQKPPTNGAQPEVQPEPGSDTNGSDPYEVNGSSGDNSTYFQAPQLFDPNDRTAQRRSPRRPPVRTAVYEQQASYRGVSAQREMTVTRQQAAADAAGWVSASK